MSRTAARLAPFGTTIFAEGGEPVKFTVTIDGKEIPVSFDEAYGKRTLEVDGATHELSVLRVEGSRLRFTVDDRPIEIAAT